MTYRPRDIERLLLSKFVFHWSDNDHRWFELQLAGLPTIRTKVSHNNKDIGPGLLGLMAKQCRVHAPFFREMLGCTRSREEYYQQIRTDPYPPWDD